MWWWFFFFFFLLMSLMWLDHATGQSLARNIKTREPTLISLSSLPCLTASTEPRIFPEFALTRLQKTAQQMFFQSYTQTSLPGGSRVCQVPARCTFLCLDSKPLTIGGSNEMLTDPRSASNCAGWMQMQRTVCEFQQGLSWPINPCKKKSDFSLTPRFTQISGPDVLALALASSHRWKGVQRHSQLDVCVISFPKTVHCAVPKHGLLNKPATPMGTMSSKQNNL